MLLLAAQRTCTDYKKVLQQSSNQLVQEHSVQRRKHSIHPLSKGCMHNVQHVRFVVSFQSWLARTCSWINRCCCIQKHG